MKILKKSLITFITLFILFVSASINTSAEDESKTEVDGGYYRVEETLEEYELEYGLSSVNYKHEKAYTAITDSQRLIGYECGGSTYSSNPLELNKEYSQNSFILELKKNSNLQIVVWSCISNGSWNLSTILQTAEDFEKKNPGYKVIAGVNGDFFDINAGNAYPYTVSGTMVSNGEVLKVYQYWPAINFKNDGSSVPITKVDTPTWDAFMTLSIYDDNDNITKTFKIDKVNEEPNEGETSAYYGLYEKEGQAHNCKYVDVSNAFIIKDSDAITVPFSNESFYGKGEITNYGQDTLKENQFAIVTKNDEVLKEICVGKTIRVQYNLTGELENANNVSGGVSTFVKDSKHIELDHYDYMQYRYPRTLVGYTADGDIIFGVTDGRQASNGYYGLNGVESAAQMIHYGCVEAYSFDGGGSSTMVILKDGKLTCVNNPSDGSLRRDGNAILIVSRVPDLEIDYTSKPTEITIVVKELEKMQGYDNFFVSLNGQILALVDGKATFTNLKPNTSYKYTVYIEKDVGYGLMPYSDDVYTQKEMFVLEDIVLNKTDNTYYTSLNIKDEQSCIITSAIYLGNKRISLKKGMYSIPDEYINYLLSNSKDAYLVITYKLSEKDEAVEVKYNLKELKFASADVGINTISDEISCIISSWLN